jgi:hypothetical protein
LPSVLAAVAASEPCRRPRNPASNMAQWNQAKCSSRCW